MRQKPASLRRARAAMGWRAVLGAVAAGFAALAAPVAAEVTVIHYLRAEQPAPPVLSNLDPRPDGLGLDGARLGLEENAATGRFLGHDYLLEVTSVPVDGDLMSAAREVFAAGGPVLLDMPAGDLLAVADMPEAEGALMFNTAAPDVALRGADCRANVLHSLPSLAMRADALMQFAVSRRWQDLAMIEGRHPEDQAFAAALRASAAKFGVKIRAAKVWEEDADIRRSAAAELPLFTQELGDHDMLLIADERGDFGRYVPYNTWLPRPVAGSEGLVPTGWAPVAEQWGAAQLQGRFEEIAGRGMQARDYAAWAAMRSIGEAVTRVGPADAGALREYILSEAFELAGFKGRPLSYRAWNGQLRQPMALVHPRALARMAPLEGFLHQRNEMDSLGLDAPEAGCGAFAQ